MNFASRLSLLVLTLCALPVRADWSGTFHMHNDPPINGETDHNGNISGQGMKTRTELTQPPMGKLIIIGDFRGQTTLMIFDDKKSFMTRDNDKLRAQGGPSLAGMHCDSDDAVTCLKQIGFAKTGSETVNGKASDRWEMDRTDAAGTKTHQTIWTPHGVKGFAVVRVVSKSPDRAVTMDVTNFKEGPLPASDFAAPAGYTDMSGHMGVGGTPPPASH